MSEPTDRYALAGLLLQSLRERGFIGAADMLMAGLACRDMLDELLAARRPDGNSYLMTWDQHAARVGELMAKQRDRLRGHADQLDRAYVAPGGS